MRLYTETKSKGIAGFEETQILNLMELKGKELFGTRFSIWNEDLSLIRKMLIYFLKNKEMAFSQTLDLRKGIIVTGPVGSGKTTLMTILKHFLPEHEQYIVRPTRLLSFEFHAEGFKTIEKYTSQSFHQVQGQTLPKAYCFDDLGLEKKIKHYGNECDVLQEIILSRYDLFIRLGMLTHFTTNLDETTLEKRYGTHVISRLSEMVNWLSFDVNSLDKRRA